VFSSLLYLEDVFVAYYFLVKEPLTSIKNKNSGSNLTRSSILFSTTIIEPRTLQHNPSRVYRATHSSPGCVLLMIAYNPTGLLRANYQDLNGICP
jgi:hypothetical protein